MQNHLEQRGKICRSKIFNITGVVIGATESYNGMWQYLIRSRGSDGKQSDALVDAADAEFLKSHEFYQEIPAKDIPKHAFACGDKARCTTHNLSGVIIEIVYSWTGEITVVLGRGANGQQKHHITVAGAIEVIGDNIAPKKKENGCVKRTPIYHV